MSQMSLTTFAKLVNIGTSYVNSSYIDWTRLVGRAAWI